MNVKRLVVLKGNSMEKYQDKWTRWHHKPTNGFDPSSNNGWIYTAYAKYLFPGSVDKQKLLRCYINCMISSDPVMINRSPGQTTPPFSKDEVLGCVSLGLLTNNELEHSHYNFCNLRADFPRKLTLKSIYKAAKALFKIKDEHRNYVWQNDIVEAYPLAFRLPPEDIYYVRRFYGKRAGIFNTVMFHLNALQTIKNGNKSARMMLWLKIKDLEMEETYIGKKVMKLEKQWVEDYFDKNHPFRQ